MHIRSTSLCFASCLLCVLSACGGAPRVGVVADGWDERRVSLDRRIEHRLAVERWAGALALADSALASREADARLHAQRALALVGLGRRDEAIAAWERSIVLDYESCSSHLDFAVLLLEMGRTGRAITELREALLFCGGEDRATARRNLAVAYLEMERPEQAADQVTRGLDERPDDPWLLGLRGLLVAEAEPVRAESLLAAATAGGAASPRFAYRYALLLLDRGRAGEAASLIEEIEFEGALERERLLNLAEAYRRLGRLDEAEGILRVLVMKKEEGAAARLRLGRVLFSGGRYEEALVF
ncbi:MAG TPA: tetratricopeptide repeat protein, partial [Alphaproteobacteria bacterium]|nr:tetratricopeptide repeat protein [Alphaproteobacteria bacterium]